MDKLIQMLQQRIKRQEAALAESKLQLEMAVAARNERDKREQHELPLPGKGK